MDTLDRKPTNTTQNMSDLETACEELIEAWRSCDDMTWEYQKGLERAAKDLETAMSERLECSICGRDMPFGAIDIESQELYCSNECIKEAKDID